MYTSAAPPLQELQIPVQASNRSSKLLSRTPLNPNASKCTTLRRDTNQEMAKAKAMPNDSKIAMLLLVVMAMVELVVFAFAFALEASSSSSLRLLLQSYVMICI